MGAGPTTKKWKPPAQIGRYRLLRRLGRGTFGFIYQVERMPRGKKSSSSASSSSSGSARNAKRGPRFAMKIEPQRGTRGSGFSVQLEARILKNHVAGLPGFPGFIDWLEPPGMSLSALVMHCLGPSLEALRRARPTKCLSLLSVCHIAVQALTRLEALHDAGFLHRDIKPDNMLVAPERAWAKDSCVYLIDLGMAKRWCTDAGAHIPYAEKKNLRGTPRYASIANHLGVEYSRQDDLESLAYTLLYLAKGSLPWQTSQLPPGFKVTKDYSHVYKLKAELDEATLTAGMPRAFREFLVYVRRKLTFTDRPDYAACRAMFQRSMEDYGWDAATPAYDWVEDPPSQSTAAASSGSAAASRHWYWDVTTGYAHLQLQSHMPRGMSPPRPPASTLPAALLAAEDTHMSAASDGDSPKSGSDCAVPASRSQE